jgi:hypothetical protein
MLNQIDKAIITNPEFFLTVTSRPSFLPNCLLYPLNASHCLFFRLLFHCYLTTISLSPPGGLLGMYQRRRPYIFPFSTRFKSLVPVSFVQNKTVCGHRSLEHSFCSNIPRSWPSARKKETIVTGSKEKCVHHSTLHSNCGGVLQNRVDLHFHQRVGIIAPIIAPAAERTNCLACNTGRKEISRPNKKHVLKM